MGAFCQSSGKTDVGMGGWGGVHSAKAQVRQMLGWGGGGGCILPKLR